MAVMNALPQIKGKSQKRITIDIKHFSSNEYVRVTKSNGYIKGRAMWLDTEITVLKTLTASTVIRLNHPGNTQASAHLGFMIKDESSIVTEEYLDGVYGYFTPVIMVQVSPARFIGSDINIILENGVNLVEGTKLYLKGSFYLSDIVPGVRK